jgi:hypothetical protein
MVGSDLQDHECLIYHIDIIPYTLYDRKLIAQAQAQAQMGKYSTSISLFNISFPSLPKLKTLRIISAFPNQATHIPITRSIMMANELPEDLVTLILLWLPVVSLLRFKCVCKSWYALITHQNFVRKHLLHNKNSNTHLLLKTSNKTMDDYVVSKISYEELQISPLTQPLPPRILGTAGSLVFLWVWWVLAMVSFVS